jgi:hypothetical protein
MGEREQAMIIMHGLFDLADEVEEGAFHHSFQALSKHLQNAGMIIGGRCMRHQPHDGYNANGPPTQHYVSIEFTDLEQAERCWSYIGDPEKPVADIHRAVLGKVQNTSFFLTSDV